MDKQVDITKFKSFLHFKKKFLSYLPENYQDENMLDVCWKWQGYTKNKDTLYNYGVIMYGHRYAAHKMAYIIFKGPVRSDQLVRHTCDNPSCVNPKHLILGNYQDNSKDMVIRNRQGSQKLNEECVKVIKWMLKYKSKLGLASKLARLHNVEPAIISAIKKGRKWSWVNV